MKERDIVELKRNFDKDYETGQVTREKAANDMLFYFITQWDDMLLEDSSLGFKGEFNILKKAGRDILADLSENPIQPDFVPKNDTSEDTAELMDGIYRTIDNTNTTMESYQVAEHEAVVCGVGAWELYTTYESMNADNNHQVIKRRALYEANNTVFWDGNAKRIDKTDAGRVTILTAYTEDGYKALVHELTGEEIDHIDTESFKQPEHSYNFPWIGGEGKKIYVGKAYYRDKVTEKHVTMVDPFGDEITMREADLLDTMDEMLDEGFEITTEKEVETWHVTQYIISGESILSEETIIGEYLPVIPQYGEYAFIEGEPHYEGITRLAKDPSRLRNFAMSYLGDILARSPRPKPIFWAEQIAGYEYMYEDNGADNNYPYLLQNKVGEHGSDLPIGPVAVMPEQTVPQSLDKVLLETRAAVQDVATPGAIPDVADVDLSGKAINAINARIDKQAFTYRLNKEYAKRHDAVVFFSMAKEIYDVPRKALMTLPDGTRKEAEIMKSVIDKETGDVTTLNDINGAEFEIFAKIGPSYTSQKEQVIEQLQTLYTGMQPGDPLRKGVELQLITMMEGPGFEDLKEFARKQQVSMGFKEPETPEEKQMLEQQAQQQKQPSAEMVLAMAENRKAAALEQKNRLEGLKAQANAENESKKRVIDEFEAVTDRAAVQVDAQEAGANINYKRADTMHKRMETAAKAKEIEKMDWEKMSDDELFDKMRGKG
jgi:hypothetical protein